MSDDVSTSMDQLVQLLEEKDNIKINEAARILDTTKDRVESWANMLKKADVVEVHYSVIGGAVLKKGPKFASLLEEASKMGSKKKSSAKSVEAPKKKDPVSVPQSITKFSKTEFAPPKDYKLIKEKIEQGEQVLERDIAKLKQEQQKIMEYLEAIISDGNKLTAYIDALYSMAVEAKQSRGEKLDEMSKETAKA